MKMKKSSVALLFGASLCLTSCGTLFTPTMQDITFTGDRGVSIYDNGKKIAEIGDGGTATVAVKKRLSNKTLIAKKEGYKNAPIILDATFNPVSVLNLLNPISWAIDLGTGKCCKWNDDVIEIELGNGARR